MTKKQLSYSSKYVTDATQKAILKGDVIQVISYVGRVKAFSYSISIEEWIQAENGFGNPKSHKRRLIDKYADHRVNYIEQICVRERIIDSQVHAIEQLMKLRDSKCHQN